MDGFDHLAVVTAGYGQPLWTLDPKPYRMQPDQSLQKGTRSVLSIRLETVPTGSGHEPLEMILRQVARSACHTQCPNTPRSPDRQLGGGTSCRAAAPSASASDPETPQHPEASTCKSPSPNHPNPCRLKPHRPPLGGSRRWARTPRSICKWRSYFPHSGGSRRIFRRDLTP